MFPGVVSILLLSLAISASAQMELFAQINTPFSITLVEDTNADFIRPDAVQERKDCGGFSHVLQLTHDNCADAKPIATCAAEIGRPTKSYVYFVAGEDASDLFARASFIVDGQAISVNVPVLNASVKTGQSYELLITGNIEPELLGKVFTARIELLSGSDNRVEICSEIEVFGTKSEAKNAISSVS